METKTMVRFVRRCSQRRPHPHLMPHSTRLFPHLDTFTPSSPNYLYHQIKVSFASFLCLQIQDQSET